MSEIDPDDLNDVIRRMRTPKHEYDRDAELMDAAEFVADFGTFNQLFEGDDLVSAQHWVGHQHAAWFMLAHWSTMRGDPNPDPEDPFEHADACDICSFLEDVAALRDAYEFEDCNDCALGLDQHDLGRDSIGRAHAYCRQVWIRAEPAVAKNGYLDPRQVPDSESWNARWYARTKDGEWALLSRTYFLGQEWSDAAHGFAGEVFMYCQDEFLVCGDLADPGGTERDSEYVDTLIEDPESMDPREMAMNAPEPEAGEWQEHAPQPYKGVLVAQPEVLA